MICLRSKQLAEEWVTKMGVGECKNVYRELSGQPEDRLMAGATASL